MLFVRKYGTACSIRPRLRRIGQNQAPIRIAYSEWALGYYEQQRAKGKRRNTAIRSLAFKWISILFRCWKDRKPYDESAYQGFNPAVFRILLTRRYPCCPDHRVSSDDYVAVTLVGKAIRTGILIVAGHQEQGDRSVTDQGEHMEQSV